MAALLQRIDARLARLEATVAAAVAALPFMWRIRIQKGHGSDGQD